MRTINWFQEASQSIILCINQTSTHTCLSFCYFGFIFRTLAALAQKVRKRMNAQGLRLAKLYGRFGTISETQAKNTDIVLPFSFDRRINRKYVT